MFFSKALPVFPEGREKEMNLTVGFYAAVPAREEATLVITGASLYSVFVNGEFILSGPARTCPGKHRVTEFPLGAYLHGKAASLTVLLYSYNTPTFCYPQQDGFLQAEVVSDGEVLAYTDAEGKGGFSCVLYTPKMQKTPRFSFQRAYAEVYRMTEREGAFPKDPKSAGLAPLPLAVQAEKTLIPQGLYLPSYPVEPVRAVIETGTVSAGAPDHSYRVREHNPSPVFTCFPLAECQCLPFDEYRSLQLTAGEKGGSLPLSLSSASYALLDFGREYTGFLTLHVETEADTTLYLAFDEVLRGGKVDPLRLCVCNIVKYELGKGKYDLLCAEPYSLRYLTLVLPGCGVKVDSVGIRRVGFPEIGKQLNAADQDEQMIYDAAVESFRQNTYDIYMDCPSRERAGWLCDSFFTSRVEYALTGKSVVERAFLENFLLADSFPDLPEGMLPMCYPSDHRDHVYIPNWAMWYVLELREYAARSGDRELIGMAKSRVLSLIRFFDRYLNADGLLEKLDSWVFVEWSKANDLTQDVNFPTNALYAAMLDAASALYDLPDLARRAEEIRAYIRENTLVNGFFCDNAVRGQDGTLTLSGLCTEACQYYMFFFGVASPETHPALWRILSQEFGPDRAEKHLYPEIFPANAFIGNYLRLDLLYRSGLYDRLLSEMKGYFLYMAEKTGTLWENIGDYASCNHGFASHAALWLLAIRGEKK